MKSIFEWQTEVSEIQSFLDESYQCDVWGVGSFENFKHLQLPWGRIINEKFTDRVIPIIKGGMMTQAVESDLNLWIRQAVQFGNSSIIVSSSGSVRIPSPLRSLAQKAEDGSIMFYEEKSNEDIIWGWNEQLYYRPKGSNTDYVVEDAQVFSIFYDESSLQPYGQSRLSASVRHQITWASRVLAYTESVAFSQSHTQLIFTNVNQEIMQASKRGDQKAVEALKAIKMGIRDAILLASNEDGSETKVSTIDPTDPSGLIKVFERIAATVASSRNLEPRELGNTAAVAPSAEAQHASKEDLVLEINKFTKKIHRTVLAVLVAVAEANEEEDPELNWGNASTPSQASMMDSLNKFLDKLPAGQFSRTLLLDHGINPRVVDEMLDGYPSTPQEAQNA